MNSAEDKVLEKFLVEPMGQFGIRELSRTTRLDTKTVMKYVQVFSKRGLVVKNKNHGFPKFEANRLNPMYRFEKTIRFMRSIMASGLIGRLNEELAPTAIVLFGSMRKGTYHEKSDIDLFVQGKEKKVDLSTYESILGRKIQLLCESNLKSLSPGLRENIYNGVVLSGHLGLP